MAAYCVACLDAFLFKKERRCDNPLCLLYEPRFTKAGAEVDKGAA